MARLSSIKKLDPEVRNQVDAFLVAHPHYTLNETIEALKKRGLPAGSRSALQRYLAGRNSSPHMPEAQTIVTVVNLQTGDVRIIKTPASSEIVEAAVSKLTAKFFVA